MGRVRVSTPDDASAHRSRGSGGGHGSGEGDGGAGPAEPERRWPPGKTSCPELEFHALARV